MITSIILIILGVLVSWPSCIMVLITTLMPDSIGLYFNKYDLHRPLPYSDPVHFQHVETKGYGARSDGSAFNDSIVTLRDLLG